MLSSVRTDEARKPRRGRGAPKVQPSPQELPILSVDLFAGGGGASHGIRQATGHSPVLAVNHDEAAIAMHAANHPETEHACESIERVDPSRTHRLIGGRTVDLVWGSPDCVHHSRAKGGKPRDRGRRALAWHVGVWVRTLRPRVLLLENVPEFKDWGPLDENNQPIEERKGEDFNQFIASLRMLGYRVEYRNLVAADYGAPTSRERLFLIARRDADPVWPEPTHGSGRLLPWRTAAECIDWSIPVRSIFERKKPLAEATLRRIAAGVVKYILRSPRPFIMTNTTGNPPRSIDEPLKTITSTGNQALVTAFLAKHFTGAIGSSLDRPMGTVTAIDHHSLVAASLITSRAGIDPTDDQQNAMGHARLIAPFVTKYYKTGIGQRIDVPLGTIVTKDRFGLVTVTIEGESYILTDIGMRMLTPRELARAQGFPDDYLLTGTKTSQIERIGNSVCPPVVRALVEAQFGARTPSVIA